MRKRQSIRLRNYDYTQPGAYFLTICATQRECLFGEIRDGEMFTNTIGDLILQTWHLLPQRFANVTLDEFVLMPNHVHGIICINAHRGAASSAPTSVCTTSLSDIVRSFKSISAIAANRMLEREGQSLWQRNYYERIIRNDDELGRIREYIANNPARWDDDAENPLCNTDR